MALQVWLPLNGNLNNQGVSNLKFSIANSATSINDAGKIGKCYYNNSNSAGGIVSDTKINLGNYVSMFCWVKMTNFYSSSSLTGIFGQHRYPANEGLGITMKYVSSTTGYLSINTGNGSGRTYNTYCGSTLLNAGTWYHIGFTYNNGAITFYVNGKVDGTATYTNKNIEDYIQLFCWSFNESSVTNVLHGNYKLNGYLNDVRIYDHCLSPKEVKEISKGLVLHYKLDDQYSESTTNIIYDSSGYQNNGTITGNLTLNSDTARYNYSSLFNAIATNYISIPYQGLQGSYNNKVWTISFWINTQQQGNRHMIVGMVGNYNTNIELSTSNTLRIYWAGTPDWSPGISCPTNTWVHIAIVITSTYIKAYKDGVLIGTNSTAPNWAGCTSNLLIGSDQRIGTYFLGAKLSDFRIYATALSDMDIKELYDTPANIDNFGNMFSMEFDEEIVSKEQILKTGIIKIDNYEEFGDYIKVLSDNSVFIKILHHNNPASNLFTSSNCWLYNDGNNLMSALIILKNCNWINNLTEYEFLVCEKLTSSSSESQVRWKQTSNPALTSTATGYTTISGSPTSTLRLLNNGNYGAMHNGNTWWCCCGSYTHYNGGIPGFTGTVTSGYMDLYIRIPDEIIKGNFANFVRFYKKSILVNQFIEK